MKLSSTLSWADRLVLVNQFELSDQEACAAFGITKPELVVAKNLAGRGIFVPNHSLNIEIYSDFFMKLRSGELDHLQRVFKPKGARPSKITMAFNSITGSPQRASVVIDTFGVSLAVLRQSKRFDKSNAGQIHIRKDKQSQELMVWRDAV